MGIGTLSQHLTASRIDARHPLCRGEFAAIVFCGDVRVLGELAGEPTATTAWKFVLPDPLIDERHDFVRVPGMLLPPWSGAVDRPTSGVCFVFTTPDHPTLLALRATGAIDDEHVVVMGAIDGLSADPQASAITEFASSLAAECTIAILGYGHQGSEIAHRLRSESDVAADRIIIYDGNSDSRRRAESDGFASFDDLRALPQDAAVVCSPLMRHETLHRTLVQARERGVPTFDNAQRASGLRQFTALGEVRLHAAARRALTLDGHRLHATCSEFPLQVSVIREDLCGINGVAFPHVHSGHRFTLQAPTDAIDLVTNFIEGPLPPSTRYESTQTYVALHDRADLGFFAARELGMRLWSHATRQVFPSEHTIDLGATAFERLLHGHLCAREVVSTMQTPAQRTILGIAARHYAADRPIVEIGSAFGGSALVMAAATDERRPPIHSIDPDASTRDIMRFAFAREGHLDRLRQIVLTSDAAISDIPELEGRCGLVFIDGLHTWSGVESDFRLYAPLVAPGGAMLFHDVAPQIEPVMRFVFGRVLRDQRFTLRCLVDGLAVFERGNA